ncbi:MAG: type II toxin-antitoxin system RelE/ParE family toxin [Gemmatimonadaceae bacterium]|nr:type II toxin-antitoxin system RelE/ParE family toxin [Gemmatimonadaceae bacterium]
MSRKLAFTARASADIEDAHAWYDSQRPGLGSEFEQELDVVVRFLEQRPDAGPVVHRTLRRLLIRRFPYAVYYHVTETTIEVRGCFHLRRHPRTWIGRA